MIPGKVGHDLTPRVKVTLVGINAREEEIEAEIDTGFNGAVSAPNRIIESLQYARLGFQPLVLADCNRISVPYYRGIVMMHGQPRIVEVISTESEPLIGLNLLFGNRLCMDIKPNGDITIEPLP